MRERVQAPDIQAATAKRRANGERPTIVVIDADMIGRGWLNRRRSRKLIRVATELSVPIVVNSSRPNDTLKLPFEPSRILFGQSNPAYEDLAIQSHVAHFRGARTETPALPLSSSQYVIGAGAAEREALRHQESPATLFPIERNPLTAAVDFIHMTTAPKPNEQDRDQKSWHRKLEPVWGPIIDLLNPDIKSAKDITIDGLKAIQEVADSIFAADSVLSAKERLKLMKKLWLGWGRDMADGIRARRTDTSSNGGTLLDHTVDRLQEGYLVLMLSLLNFKHADTSSPQAKSKAENQFIDSLLTATATILPTIAKAQDGMLGVVAPEKSPDGGSRVDRIIRLSAAANQSAKGNYAASERNITRMRTAVTKAFEHRSTPTELYRTDVNDPTTFDINKLDPKNFKSPELKPLRDKVANWLQFVWLAQQMSSLVADTLEKKGHGDLVEKYKTAVEKQLGAYAKAPVKDIAADWNTALETESFTINEELSPQTLLKKEGKKLKSRYRRMVEWFKEDKRRLIPWAMTASRPVFGAAGALLYPILPLASGISFVLGALSDAEGWFARKFNATTKIGEKADPFADGLYRAGIAVTAIIINPVIGGIVTGLELMNMTLNIPIQKKEGHFVPFTAKAGTFAQSAGFMALIGLLPFFPIPALAVGGGLMLAGTAARFLVYAQKADEMLLKWLDKRDEKKAKARF